MRGSTKKMLRLWASKTWNSTPAEQREGFNSFEHYVERIKTEWKSNKRFQIFIKDTLNSELV